MDDACKADLGLILCRFAMIYYDHASSSATDRSPLEMHSFMVNHTYLNDAITCTLPALHAFSAILQTSLSHVNVRSVDTFRCRTRPCPQLAPQYSDRLLMSPISVFSRPLSAQSYVPDAAHQLVLCARAPRPYTATLASSIATLNRYIPS